MWSAVDLPLLRNIYSVLLAKYQSELLTLGLTRVPLEHFQELHLPSCLQLQALGKFVPWYEVTCLEKCCPPSSWAERQTRTSQLGCF